MFFKVQMPNSFLLFMRVSQLAVRVTHGSVRSRAASFMQYLTISFCHVCSLFFSLLEEEISHLGLPCSSDPGEG